MYCADLLSLAERHRMMPHLYVNDTQMYGFCGLEDVDSLDQRVTNCDDDVPTCMDAQQPASIKC
jgi:hypothetical protein